MAATTHEIKETLEGGGTVIECSCGRLLRWFIDPREAARARADHLRNKRTHDDSD